MTHQSLKCCLMRMLRLQAVCSARLVGSLREVAMACTFVDYNCVPRVFLQLFALACTGTPCVGVALLNERVSVLHIPRSNGDTEIPERVYVRILRAETCMRAAQYCVEPLTKCLTGSPLFIPKMTAWHASVTPLSIHVLKVDAIAEKYRDLRRESTHQYSECSCIAQTFDLVVLCRERNGTRAGSCRLLAIYSSAIALWITCRQDRKSVV